MAENGSIEALVALGFTGAEAEVYTALLRESPTTGYRIAQSLGKPVANTYKAIESLEKKGAVLVDEGANRFCRAVPPDELLARLERGFADRRARAARELAWFREGPGDDRVYQMRSREQVMERARQMLERCEEVALLDVFPGPLAELRAHVESAVARGAAVALKVYEPVAIAGAEVILTPNAAQVLSRWPGEWVNVVVDGGEHLLAFLEADGGGVHQAVWSGSAYISWVYHSAVSSELVLAALEARIEGGATAARLRADLARFERLKALQAPGYHTLLRRFGGPEAGARPSRVGRGEVMRNLVCCICLTVQALAVATPAALGSQQTPTVETVLDRVAEALGGREALARVETSHVRFEMEAAGLRGTGEVLSTARGQERSSYDLAGLAKGLVVFDSRRGWTQDANGKVRDLSALELEGAVLGAYLGTSSHLLSGRMPGRVTLAGEDDERRHYLVRLEPEGGTPTTLYVDKTTFLPAKREQRAGDQTQTFTFDDWREVDGLKVAFSTTQGTGDPRSLVRIRVVEVRHNAPVAASAFERPAESVADHRFASGSSALAIPFELTSNHIYLQVRVNGAEPLWFLLDTGAERSVISTPRAKDLGLELAGKVVARGGGEGTMDAYFIKNATLAVQGAEVADQTLVAISLAGIEPFEGRRMDGILGYDFISRFVVEIDYAASRINLYEPKGYTYAGKGERLPIEIEGGIPRVRGRLSSPGREPLEGRFTIDTGARSALTLNAPFVASTWLRQEAERGVEALHGIGVGGASKTRVGRVGALVLGRLELERVVAGFTYDKAGAFADPDEAGNIGGEVLRRFKTIFDYSRKEMILEPNAAFGEPFEFDMFGAALARPDLGPGPLRVHRVTERTPAAEAGLREGDEILSVDGRPVSELSLDEARRMFRGAGREVRVEFRRGGDVREVKVTLRRIV